MFMTYFTDEKQSAEVYIIFSFLLNFFLPFAFVSFCSEITDIYIHGYMLPKFWSSSQVTKRDI